MRHHRKLHKRYGHASKLTIYKRLHDGALKAAHSLAKKIRHLGGKA